MAFEKYGYVLTETAVADINETFDYISGNLSNSDAASHFADELENKIDEICRISRTGKKVENEYLKRDDIRRFLVSSYIVYYIIDEKACNIVILRLVYGRQNQDRILRNL